MKIRGEEGDSVTMNNEITNQEADIINLTVPVLII